MPALCSFGAVRALPTWSPEVAICHTQHGSHTRHVNALIPAQVSPDASADELKRAFRKRALESHPDVAKNNADSRRHHFGAVLNAYKVCPISKTPMAVIRSLTAMPDSALLPTGTQQPAAAGAVRRH